MMRILFFSNVFPNPLNPSKGTFNRTMIDALAESHNVHVVSPVSWTDALRGRVRGQQLRDSGPLALAGKTERTVDYPRFWYPPKMLRSQYGRFLWQSVGGKLQEVADTFRPDVVFAYWTHPDGEVAVRLARQRGVPAVLMTGGSDVLLLARRGRRRRRILNVLHKADAVVTVSRDIRRRLQEDGIPDDTLHVVYRGVDRTLFHPGDRKSPREPSQAARQRLGLDTGETVLVSVGRLVPVKGFPVLIDACRRLIDAGVPLACYVFGAGPCAAELRRQVEKCGFHGIVRLAGPRPQSELADWYRAADLTVLPSLSEGVPNVLLESMACGTPFVASRVGGIPEIADPRHDRLVPPGDADALAAAIFDGLSASDTSLGRHWEPVTWQDSATELSRIFEDVMGRHVSDHRDNRLTTSDESAVTLAEPVS